MKSSLAPIEALGLCVAGRSAKGVGLVNSLPNVSGGVALLLFGQ